MYCKKCGTENEDDYKFCQQCGYPLKKIKKNRTVTRVLLLAAIVCVGAGGVLLRFSSIPKIWIAKVREQRQIAYDKESGLTYVKNELLIQIDKNCKQEEIEACFKKYNGKIVESLPEIQTYRVQFKGCDYEKLCEIQEAMQKETVVVHTGLNLAFELTPYYYPNDERWKNSWDEIPDGENWGLEMIGADEAWDYRDDMQEVTVGIIDNMFEENHEDLHFDGEILANRYEKFNSHGTHVSGIIGADFDNAKGICGVMPKVKLVAVSITGMEQYYKKTTSYAFQNALTQLICQKNAKVVNISMGVQNLGFCASRGNQSAIAQLKYLNDELENCLSIIEKVGYEFIICQASGNSNSLSEDSSYKYVRADAGDADYGYIPYNDENKKEWKKYKNLKERLEWGNVDAKYDIFSGIETKKIKERILVVGAVEKTGE